MKTAKYFTKSAESEGILAFFDWFLTRDMDSIPEKPPCTWPIMSREGQAWKHGWNVAADEQHARLKANMYRIEGAATDFNLRLMNGLHL